MESIEQRLVELETKLAYQDDTVLALNDVIARQQGQLDQLENTVKHLVERVQRLAVQAEASDPAVQEIPPHY
ncbi:MAG: SlyX family protein [Methylococcaceae bacterium]|nr:SlyX family protein [Methylococcaceae bacterium]